MCTDNNIRFPFRQFADDTFLLRWLFKTREVLDSAWEVFESAGECLVMLQRKNGSWDEDSNLLAVSHCFKSSTDSNFCLTKSHITAYQPVHGYSMFHTILGSRCRFFLIRGILIDKRCFQLLLQVGIG
ncbi:hypothetical protein ES708_34984 [subsurface metagenome]